MNHSTAIQQLGEGSVQAVCSCGWRSLVFGTDKTAGTMDPLQHASEAADLHEWEMSLRLAVPDVWPGRRGGVVPTAGRPEGGLCPVPSMHRPQVDVPACPPLAAPGGRARDKHAYRPGQITATTPVTSPLLASSATAGRCGAHAAEVSVDELRAMVCHRPERKAL